MTLAMNLRKKEAGFTFIELMVVVAILAVLIAIVAPRIMGRTDEAKRTASIVQLRNIEQALQLYKLDTGDYPSTEQGLQALVSKPTDGKAPLNWRAGGYLPKVPVDAWGREFVYLSPGGQYGEDQLRDFDIVSYGSDGEQGGEGKNADIQSWEVETQ